MKIQAHDENALTNLLFSEVHRHAKIEALLGAIHWRSHEALPFSVADVELHQQVNFSEFGKPDAILLVVDTAGHLHVVIIEAKLARYKDACALLLADRRFNNQQNSKLNNQLTLRYRAMRSLGSIEREGFLTERGHADDSPYAPDITRRCKKSQTIRFLKQVLAHPEHFYLVSLTGDDTPPLPDLPEDDPSFPLLYDQRRGAMDTGFPNLGSLTWSACDALFGGADNHFSPSYAHLIGAPPEAAEEGEEEEAVPLPGGARHIVEFEGKPCLFNYQKNLSFTVFSWNGSQFVKETAGTKDAAQFAAIQRRIRWIQKAPKLDRERDVAAWRAFFHDLRARHPADT